MFAEVHLRQPELTYSACVLLTKKNKIRKIKKWNKQKKTGVYIKMIKTKSVFNIAWLIAPQKIYTGERLQTKYYSIIRLYVNFENSFTC